MNDEIRFPLKSEIQAQGKPVELDFSVNAYFGTHDREESGEVPLAIINKEEKIFAVDKVSENWQEIAPGVEIKHELTYSGNSRKSQYSLRVQPDACPLTIHAKHFHENSASDYPHHGESQENYYSILVKKQ
jgi:hypothetical protein